MTTPYFIAPSPPAGFAAALFAVSYERPLGELYEIERKLAERGVTGAILLDMLLANASATHRYFVLRFDGIKFTSQTERVGGNAGVGKIFTPNVQGLSTSSGFVAFAYGRAPRAALAGAILTLTSGMRRTPLLLLWFQVQGLSNIERSVHD
jgi:hypothetical protein